ncbi:MAG: hypothetical protein ACRCUJ_02980 [Phocaeicola sp.]
MIVTFKGIPFQVVAYQIEVNEVAVELKSKTDDLVASFPRKEVDKVLDFGITVYDRERGLLRAKA